MTIEEKKAVLMRYQHLERRIARMVDEKRRWQEKATAMSPVYSDMPKSRGPDKIQNAVCRIIELENDINREIDAQIDLRRQIESAVNNLEDDRLRDIVRRRYIDGITWDDISKELSLDERWVRRLNARAIRELTLESPP